MTMEKGGRLHFPGIGREAALWLIEQRKIIGIGIDTLGIDPGSVRGTVLTDARAA